MSYIVHPSGKLHYTKSGHGATALLLFHGFGQSNNEFASWQSLLERKYTLFAFDLYFHGQSDWSSSEPLEKIDWKEVMTEFIKQEGLDTFEVAGFSLGGKFALATLEAFPEKIKRLILMAPDGVKTSLWYTTATYSITLRYLFRSMIKNPGRFYSVASFFNSLGLVSNRVRRFAESQMDTEEKRKRVYSSWVCFRHLKFNIDKISNLLNRYSIPLVMILGKYDKVTPPRTVKKFLSIVDNKEVRTLEVSHRDLIKNAAQFLVQP